MITQQRARIGGEYGANGEFYEGGKFIATQDRAKGKPKPAKKYKMEIAPFKWEMQPSVGMRPVFRASTMDVENGVASPRTRFWELCYEMGGLTLSEFCPMSREALDAEYAQCVEQCERFNAGERWERL